MGILSGIKSILGFSGVGETAIKIIEKLSGTDYTDKEKAQFVLDYMDKTKHQSPTRRILAIAYVSEQIMLVTVWVVSKAAHRLMDFTGAGLLADDVNLFLQSNVNINMGIIIGFYFLLGMRK